MTESTDCVSESVNSTCFMSDMNESAINDHNCLTIVEMSLWVMSWALNDVWSDVEADTTTRNGKLVYHLRVSSNGCIAFVEEVICGLIG